MVNEIKFKCDMPYPCVCPKMCKKDAELLMGLYSANNGSEMTSVSQYIYQSFWIRHCYPDIADIFENIAHVEMMHLKLLARAIIDSCGDPKFAGCGEFWCGKSVNYCKDLGAMLTKNIQEEKEAIKCYRCIASKVCNHSIKCLLERIALDEEMHICALNIACEMYKKQGCKCCPRPDCDCCPVKCEKEECCHKECDCCCCKECDCCPKPSCCCPTNCACKMPSCCCPGSSACKMQECCSKEKEQCGCDCKIKDDCCCKSKCEWCPYPSSCCSKEKESYGCCCKAKEQCGCGGKMKEDCCPKPKCDCCPQPKCDCCPQPKCDCCPQPKYDCCPKPKCDCCPQPKYDCCPKPKCDCCPQPKCDCCPKPKCDCCPPPKCDCCPKPKCDCCPYPKDCCDGGDMDMLKGQMQTVVRDMEQMCDIVRKSCSQDKCKC